MYSKNEEHKNKCLEYFDLGLKYICEENYKMARCYLNKSARLGHYESLYILGIWYLFGVDCIELKQNIPSAIYCLIKSAYKGHVQSKEILKTFLKIDIDVLNLTEKNINSIINIVAVFKCDDVKNAVKIYGYKILENIKNPHITQPIIKTKEAELNKLLLLKRCNNTLMKHDNFKPKPIHTKQNNKFLIQLLNENKRLKQENELLKAEINKIKQEQLNLCATSDNTIPKLLENKQQTNIQIQEIPLQNIQINTNIILQNEYMQPTNFNQQKSNEVKVQGHLKLYLNDAEIKHFNQLQSQQTIGTQTQMPQIQYNQFNNMENQTYQIQYNQLNNTVGQFNNHIQQQNIPDYNHNTYYN